MKRPIQKMVCLTAAISVASFFSAGQALSQATPQVKAGGYPTKPVRLIVPWPAGGGTDIVSRTVGQKMSENMGQQVIVENRPGAAAIIGTDFAAKAAPDGYTLLMGNIGPNSANASLYKKLPYDSIRDFAPVSLVASAPYIMVVHPSVPAKSVKEFIALAKSSPGKINFGSGGTGSAPHLAAELLKMMARIDLEHIPYKGCAAHTVALLGGEVDLTLNSPLEVLAHARSGKLRALAVTTEKRSPVAPELPTMAEAGLPGYEFIVWWGVLAPAGTPVDIVSKVYSEVSKALQAQDVQQRFASQGVDVVGSTPEKFAAFIKSEVEKWARVVREAKIPAQ
jgi:tripartite-type tricarboxylate transporter receptor subunit TctC